MTFSQRVRAFLTAPERRRQALILAVGGVILAALAVGLASEPERLAPIVGERHVETVAGADGPLAAALRSAGLSADGAPRPAVSPGPCGDKLTEAVDGLAKWGADVAGRRDVPHITCRLDRNEAAEEGAGVGVVLDLALPGEEAPTSWRRALPDGTSLLPPLIAILFAVAFRQVLIALGAAVWLGATFVAGGDPLVGLWSGVVDYAAPGAGGNWRMFAFTFSLIGMVNVLVRGGGVQGVVDAFSRRARGRRSTQLVTAAMGTAIFFDDYANSVVVGASARPLTDARRISREKLAYLVDSTAAPIAGIAIISTWIGIELQFLGEQLAYVPEAASAYDLFFQVVPYRFYCLFTLAFVYLVVLTQRDFGPMLKAERRAIQTGQVSREGAVPLAAGGFTQTTHAEGIPIRWYNAVIPIVLTVTAALGGFVLMGYGPMVEAGETFDLLTFATWRSAFVYGGDYSTHVLAVSGAIGSFTAILLVVTQRILSLREAVLSWLQGVWAMRLAFGILVLAISIRGVTEDLDTAPFLVSLLHDVPAVWLPMLSFLVAAAVAFSTGTSWGTMGILLPVVVPLVAHQIGATPEVAGPVLLLAVASVLDGAIFGDHCSPISDTTVLSSLASAADHMDHVRTQVPYAVLTMGVSGLFGYLLVAWTGWPWLLVFPMGVVTLALVLFAFGRRA